MLIGHIYGIPVEETALQVGAAGAATITVVTVAGRAKLGRLQRRIRQRALRRNH
jgi:hypothetical protein